MILITVGSSLTRVPGIHLIKNKKVSKQFSTFGNATTMTSRSFHQHIPGFLRWIKKCNNGLSSLTLNPSETTLPCTPLLVGEEVIGYINADLVKTLSRFSYAFSVSDINGNVMVSINDELETANQRTEAVGQVLQHLREEGLISGWRDELYPVGTAFKVEPLLLIERAAAAHFGVKAYGVHVNGFVRNVDGALDIWVARRSATKQTWPGKLDHIVAGGQPHALSCQENVIKECWEEAGIPASLAEKAIPVGAVSYVALQAAGIKRDVLFCYDLELPLDFIPVPQDGEVESFEKMSIEKVARLISDTEEFKDNCNLVLIDFMVRHGLIGPDDPSYLSILTGLKHADCT